MMINGSQNMKVTGALFVILEDHCGPPFFVCHCLDVTNKKKGVRISPCTNFFTMFIFHVRTLEFQFRTRVISQNAFIFTF